jgi:hypothetical protein
LNRSGRTKLTVTLIGLGTLIATGLVAWAAPAETKAKTQSARAISPTLEEWLSGVDRHVPGERDRVVALIAPWSGSELDAVLSEFKPFIQGRAPLARVGWASRADADRTLKRAAVLHADIAAMHRIADGYSLPSDGRPVVVGNDGQQVGGGGGTVHWGFGRRLLDLRPPDDEVRLWYRATAAFLQSWDEYSELEPHLRRGRELFPRDPVLLLYEGALHEAYAEPRIQNLYDARAPSDPRLLPTPAATQVKPIDDPKAEWRAAGARFEKALSIDPGLTAARIRLAHVRGVEDRHEDAATELRRCVGEPLSPLMQYYAWLLLGREERALGRRDAAREAFARAMALCPGAQSPRLGLSLLARDAGDRATALGALDLLSKRASMGVDPWWAYSRGASPAEADELFSEMRRELAP